MAETDTTQRIARVLASFGSVHDSSAIIDAHVNAVLARLRAGPDLAARLYDALGKNVTWAMGGKPYTKIEDWLLRLPPVFVYRPDQESTKYNGVDYMIWGQTGHVIGGTLNVGGIFLGTDKLGHFFQQGYEYFCKGQDRQANERYGRSTETGKFGLLTTGVYSHADLEANRKGFEFYTALASNTRPSFRILDYVSARWNEESNPSYYGLHIAPQVWSNLLTGSWRGSFSDGSTSRPIAATITANARGSVSGSFSWASSSGRVSGTFTGKYQLLVCHMGSSVVEQLIVDPVVGLRYPQRTVAATGLLIRFDWTSGGNRGTGYWRTHGERRMIGEWVKGQPKLRDDWAGGTSPGYDGTWTLNKE